MSAAAESGAAGMLIGGFKVLREIQAGAGSQGTVFKAECVEDVHGIVPPGTVVALKMMVAQGGADAQWRKLRARTAELSRLVHPNVVRYLGCFAERDGFSDRHVVVQEFLRGETLKDRLARHPKGLDADEALRIAEGALAGLAYTAGRGIVHRDVKPGNIFVCTGPGGMVAGVKIIDFEIAKREGGTATTAAGNLAGSFDYMAPDFLSSPDFHGDERSDVFSMGAVLHEALTGRTPYARGDGDARQAQFAYISRWSGAADPISVSSRIARVLTRSEGVLEKALARDPARRHAGFAAFAAAVSAMRCRELRNPRTGAAYRIVQFAGKGGFGEVFKARRVDGGETVAVKHLLKAEYSERFRREAKVLEKMRDDAIVRFVDFFETENAALREAFIVMSFLPGMPGRSLRDAIRRRRAAGGRLPAHAVLAAFERYAHGLAAMHRAGVVHRDVKPSNLYFPAGDPLRSSIMDLGIALDVRGTVTSGAMPPGTPDYMPPEASQDAHGDSGFDVYALGLCLYEALTCRTAYPRLPTTGNSAWVAFFDRVAKKTRPKFDDAAVASDRELLSLLAAMTDIDPRRRLGDASIVEARLRKIRVSRYGDGPVPAAETVDDSTLDAPPDDGPTTAMPSPPKPAPQPPPAPQPDAPPTKIIVLPTNGEPPSQGVEPRRRVGWLTAAALVILAATGVGAFFARDKLRPAAEGEVTTAIESNRGLSIAIEDSIAVDSNREPSTAVEEPRAVESNRLQSIAFEEPPSAPPPAPTEPATVSVPALPPGVSCRIDGALASGGASIALLPGVHAAAYEKDDHEPQTISFSVSAGGSATAPAPGEWKPTAALSALIAAEAAREKGGWDEVERLLPAATVYGGDAKRRKSGLIDALEAYKAELARIERERLEKEEAERKAKEEAERIAREQAERDEAERIQREALEKRQREEAAREAEKRRQEAARAAREKAEREEAERRQREEEERRRLERRKELMGRCGKLIETEPIRSRMIRLDNALDLIADAERGGVFSADDARALRDGVAARRKWIVGEVRNDCGFAVKVADREIASGASETFVFKNGLPSPWNAVAEGWEPRAMPTDFEGLTEILRPRDFRPSEEVLRKAEEARKAREAAERKAREEAERAAKAKAEREAAEKRRKATAALVREAEFCAGSGEYQLALEKYREAKNHGYALTATDAANVKRAYDTRIAELDRQIRNLEAQPKWKQRVRDIEALRRAKEKLTSLYLSLGIE